MIERKRRMSFSFIFLKCVEIMIDYIKKSHINLHMSIIFCTFATEN